MNGGSISRAARTAYVAALLAGALVLGYALATGMMRWSIPGALLGLAFVLPVLVVLLAFDAPPRAGAKVHALLVGWGFFAGGGGGFLLSGLAFLAIREVAPVAQTQLLLDVVAAPVAEEIAKGLGVVWAFVALRDRRDTLYDGFLFGSLVGVGFGLVENIAYFGKLGTGGELILQRLVGALAHPALTGAIGTVLAVAYARTKRHGAALRSVVVVLGVVCAVGLHATGNLIKTERTAIYGLLAFIWVGFLAVTLVERRKNVPDRARHDRADTSDVESI